MEMLTTEDRTIEDVIVDFPVDFEKLEAALNNCIPQNDPKILKTEFPDKWNYLNKKLGYTYEYFNSHDDYQKLVTELKKEFGEFGKDFSKL